MTWVPHTPLLRFKRKVHMYPTFLFTYLLPHRPRSKEYQSVPSVSNFSSWSHLEHHYLILVSVVIVEYKLNCIYGWLCISLLISTYTYVPNHKCVYNGSRQGTLPDFRCYEVIVTRVDHWCKTKDLFSLRSRKFTD